MRFKLWVTFSLGGCPGDENGIRAYPKTLRFSDRLASPSGFSRTDSEVHLTKNDQLIFIRRLSPTIGGRGHLIFQIPPSTTYRFALLSFRMARLCLMRTVISIGTSQHPASFAWVGSPT